VSDIVRVCAPSWVVNGLLGKETKVEGTCGTLVTDIKSIKYDGGKYFTWKV
jgi:hypothetical protein